MTFTSISEVPVVGVPPGGEASGGLTSYYPDPGVVNIRGQPLVITDLQEGYGLLWLDSNNDGSFEWSVAEGPKFKLSSLNLDTIFE